MYRIVLLVPWEPSNWSAGSDQRSIKVTAFCSSCSGQPDASRKSTRKHEGESPSLLRIVRSVCQRNTNAINTLVLVEEKVDAVALAPPLPGLSTSSHTNVILLITAVAKLLPTTRGQSRSTETFHSSIHMVLLCSHCKCTGTEWKALLYGCRPLIPAGALVHSTTMHLPHADCSSLH